MAKVSPIIEEKKDIFLYSTEIENLFISEFLPDAPGDYVKVYIFGLMYASYGQDFDSRKIAIRLGLNEEEVEEAWIYWESRGLVRILRDAESRKNGEIRLLFRSQIETLYGRLNEEPVQPAPAPEEEAETLYVNIDDIDYDESLSEKLIDRRLLELYEKYQMVTGRTVSRQETSKIEDAVKVYGIEPEIFDFAIDYCADLEKYSIDYIFKVALRWTEEGCRTAEEARRLLDKHSRRNDMYRKVFKALGFNRLPAPADREIMDRWFDELDCSIGEVIDACNAAAGLRDPNLRYVNKVIENRRLEKGGVNTRAAKSDVKGGAPSDSAVEGSPVSRKVLTDYFDYIRTTDEKAHEARVEEVIRKIPAMKGIYDAESRVNARMLSMRPGADNLDARQRLRAERIAIEESRKQLLAENGFPVDYLTRKYRCAVCRDTGYTDKGMVCSCCRERAAEAYKWHTDKEKA